MGGLYKESIPRATRIYPLSARLLAFAPRRHGQSAGALFAKVKESICYQLIDKGHIGQ
jgi:hypothetical protein